jgi:hypothetical protein
LAVAFQNPAEMIFIDRDHMVEAPSPETSNHRLHKRILPGTPGRRDHFFDPILVSSAGAGAAQVYGRIIAETW